MAGKVLKASEEGPVFVAGKPYYWALNDDDRLVLHPWPMLEDGQPAPNPRGVQQ